MDHDQTSKSPDVGKRGGGYHPGSTQIGGTAIAQRKEPPEVQAFDQVASWMLPLWKFSQHVPQGSDIHCGTQCLRLSAVEHLRYP